MQSCVYPDDMLCIPDRNCPSKLFGSQDALLTAMMKVDLTRLNLYSRFHEVGGRERNCECMPQNHFQPGCADFPEAVVFTIEFLSCKGALAAAESTDGLIYWA